MNFELLAQEQNSQRDAAVKLNKLLDALPYHLAHARALQSFLVDLNTAREEAGTPGQAALGHQLNIQLETLASQRNLADQIAVMTRILEIK